MKTKNKFNYWRKTYFNIKYNRNAPETSQVIPITQINILKNKNANFDSSFFFIFTTPDPIINTLSNIIKANPIKTIKIPNIILYVISNSSIINLINYIKFT